MPFATILLDALPWLIGVWLFAFGGAIGSFLNVVVYRVPAGISLVHPGSHCPRCKTPIRWSDNVPIFGWLFLRGRCRACNGAISARYPTVEAVTATMFVVLGLAESVPYGIDPTATAEQTVAELWGVYSYHLLLLCTLLAAVGIEFDGHRVAPRLFAPATIAGLAAPVFWPYLHGVHACSAMPAGLAGIADGPTGLAAGLLCGWGASRVCRTGRAGLICGLGVAGLFLGWQAVVVLAVVVGAVCLLPAARRRQTPILWLTVATFVWILII
ncbi:MAG: prepilin peptidase [Candidatus Nealsonbacteria bacterium]|nr:prepilin peptidase [Candidatus Nealsonbacteria bacterium]